MALLAYGANVNATDANGHTALKRAHVNVVGLLLNAYVTVPQNSMPPYWKTIIVGEPFPEDAIALGYDAYNTRLYASSYHVPGECHFGTVASNGTCEISYAGGVRTVLSDYKVLCGDPQTSSLVSQ
ncbi:UNVERIFIED_CONTAM: hypothetical protein HDU68_002941 [Siphonaria sp. JEL0065]|nr:hypothetical protein HDU68_002941 [Siphonaria sp. JEL0065]